MDEGDEVESHSNWPYRHVADLLRDQPRRPEIKDWYTNQITRLYNLGFNLATDQMIDLYESLDPDELWDVSLPYEKITAFRQWHAMCTHDRSQHVDQATNQLAEHFSKEIKKGEAWLLPVYDDEEYVLWIFEVAVGSEKEVVRQLAKAAGAIIVEVPTEIL